MSDEMEPARLPLEPVAVQSVRGPVEDGPAGAAGSGDDVTGAAQDAPRPVERRGFSDRFSPRTQGVISAVLMLSTLVVFFGYWQILMVIDPNQAPLFSVAFTVFYGVYFVVCVFFMARRQGSRRLAVIVAAIAAGVDIAYTAYEISPSAVETETMTGLAYTVILIVYVAAWGIARRQHRNWWNGLPLAMLVAGVCHLGVSPYLEPSWFSFWFLYVGAFTAGCVICWVLDATARRSEPSPAPEPNRPSGDRPVGED